MANKFTYINADNSAGDSTDLGNSGQDVFVKQIVWGDPDNGDVTILHNAIAQPGHASGMASIAVGNAAFKLTQPTAAAGLDLVKEMTFSGKGLRLDGGSIHTDCEHVTVLWEYVS